MDVPYFDGVVSPGSDYSPLLTAWVKVNAEDGVLVVPYNLRGGKKHVGTKGVEIPANTVISFPPITAKSHPALNP